jgi:hypothetical protein
VISKKSLDAPSLFHTTKSFTAEARVAFIGDYSAKPSAILLQPSLKGALVSGQVNFVGICKGTARRAPTKNQAPIPANFVLTAR